MKLSDLKAAEYNPREITPKAFDGLKYSLDEFGDISGIVFNERTGNLVSGHQRVKAIQEKYGDLNLSYSEDGSASFVTPDGNIFKVRLVDWDRKKEKAANISANNPHIQGDFLPGLQIQLQEIKLESPDLASALNFEPLELNSIQHGVNIPFNKPDIIPKASVNVTIGEYVFKVDRETYLSWIEKVKLEVGYNDQLVLKEIKKRLCIEN